MVNDRKSHYLKLRDSWIKRHIKVRSSLWEKHEDALFWIKKNSKNLALSSATGLLLLAHPANASTLIDQIVPTPPTQERGSQTKESLVEKLKNILPSTVQPLTKEQSARIEEVLSDTFHLKARVELEGITLNRNYGIIGAEQHLMRYPGDNMKTHFVSADDSKYYSSGMAPGRGAWGYFTSSGNNMSPKDILREKYYIAVQSFLSPNWNEDPNKIYQFLKYRKMLVVNPENGESIVVVIGDAGPAEWTGKHLGGSPEVMAHLKRQDGAAKGPVLYYFIDDPDDIIPLGPISLN